MPTAQQIQIDTIRGWLETKPELIPGCAEIAAHARQVLAEYDAKQEVDEYVDSLGPQPITSYLINSGRSGKRRKGK